MSKSDFEARKEALLKEIHTVLEDVEKLYENGVEAGTEEAKELKAKLQDKLGTAKEKLHHFEAEAGEKLRHHAREAQEKFRRFEQDAEERVKQGAHQADEMIRDKPYYAIGFAALAGLVVGVLLNRR
ncbi:YqjD family protein [Neisseria sp.]|uniref:DUF883 family protein n=1 Tax=Neisseria sp. TaxID=192066 RepID=UPI0035A0A7CC